MNWHFNAETNTWSNLEKYPQIWIEVCTTDNATKDDITYYLMGDNSKIGVDTIAGPFESELDAIHWMNDALLN